MINKTTLWVNFIIVLLVIVVSQWAGDFSEVRAWGSAILLFMFLTEIDKVIYREKAEKDKGKDYQVRMDELIEETKTRWEAIHLKNGDKSKPKDYLYHVGEGDK